MVSLEISIFGFYSVVIGAFLAISHAQFPGENWQGGKNARDIFQRPLFSAAEQSSLTGLLQNQANTQSNVLWVSRNSLSAKHTPLPRKTSYGKSYGSRVKRRTEELQAFKNELSPMPTDLRNLRIKRQAPGFQVWDFHPSSLVRRRLIEAREQSNRNTNVPTTIPRSSTEQITQESSASKSRLEPLLTERQVVSIAGDLKLQPADVNIHLPVANYNALTQENKMPLNTQTINEKSKGKSNLQKTQTESYPMKKKKTGTTMQNTSSNIIINKNARSQTRAGPKYSNKGPRAKVSPQKQFDFTAAALKGKETGSGRQHSNNRNQRLDHGSGKADGTRLDTARQYLNSNDVLLDIKALSDLIDRTTKILIKQKGLPESSPDKHTLNSETPSEQRPKAYSEPRQANRQITPGRAIDTFEKKQQPQGRRHNLKDRVKPVKPQNLHKEMLVPQPSVRKESMPLQASRQTIRDSFINAQVTKMQKETPIQDTRQIYLKQNKQQMSHGKMESTPAPWARSQNKEGLLTAGRKSSEANIPLGRTLQHNQNSRTKAEPTFALLQQKQAQQKEQMLSNEMVKNQEQVRQPMTPQKQTHGQFLNLLLNEPMQVSQEATPLRQNLQQFGEVFSATTKQPVEPVALQHLPNKKTIDDFGKQTQNLKTNRRLQKELQQSKTSKQQRRASLPIPEQHRKNVTPQKQNQRRFQNKMSNTRNTLLLSNEPALNQMPNAEYNLQLTQEPVPGQMSNTAFNLPLNQEPVPNQMSNSAYNLPFNQEPVPNQVSNTAYNLPLTQGSVPGQMSNIEYNLPFTREPVPNQISNTAYNLLINQEPVSNQMSNTANNLPLTQESVPGQMSNTEYNLPLTREPVPNQISNTAFNLPLNQEPVPNQMSNTANYQPLTRKPVPNQIPNTANNVLLNQEPVPNQMSNTAYNQPLTREPVPNKMPNTAYNLPHTEELVPNQMPITEYNLPLTQEPVPNQLLNTAYNLLLTQEPVPQEPVPNQMSRTAYNLPLNDKSVSNQRSIFDHNMPFNHEPVQNQMSNAQNNMPYTSVQQHLQQEPQQLLNTQAQSPQGDIPVESSPPQKIKSKNQFVQRPKSVKQTQQISDHLRLAMPEKSGQTFVSGQKRRMSQEAKRTQEHPQQARISLRQNQQFPKQTLGTEILPNPTPKFMTRDRQIPPEKARGIQKSSVQASVTLKQNKSSLAQTLPKPLSMHIDQQYSSQLTQGKQASPTHAPHTVQHEQQASLQQILGAHILPTEALMTLQQAHEFLHQNIFNDQTLTGTGVSQTDTKLRQHILNPKIFEGSSQNHQNPMQVFANQNHTAQAPDFLRQNQEPFYKQVTNVDSTAPQDPHLQDQRVLGQNSLVSKHIQFRQNNQKEVDYSEAKQPPTDFPRHQQQFKETHSSSNEFLPRFPAIADQRGQRMKNDQTRSQKTQTTTPVPSSYPHKRRIGHKSQLSSMHDRLKPVHPKLNSQIKPEVKRNNLRQQVRKTSSSTPPQEKPMIGFTLNDNRFQIKSKLLTRKLHNTNPGRIKQSARRQSDSAANGQDKAQGIPLAFDLLLQTDLGGQNSVQNHNRQERVTKKEPVKKETSMMERNSKRRKQNPQKNAVTNFVRYTTISPPSRGNNQPEFIQHDVKAPTKTALRDPLKPLNVWNPSPDASSGHPVATNWNVPKRKNRGRSRSSKNISSGRRNGSKARTSSSRSVKGGQYVKNWFNPRQFEGSNADQSVKNASFDQSSSNNKSNAPRDVIKKVNENNRNQRLINSTPKINSIPQKRPFNQAGKNHDIRRKNRNSVVNKQGMRRNPGGKSTQWEIQRGRSGRRPGNVERPVNHPDSQINNIHSSPNTLQPKTPQKRIHRGRNRPVGKRPVKDIVRPVERTPYTDSTTTVYTTTLSQSNRRNRPVGKRPVIDTARPVGKLPIKQTVKPFERTTTNVYATTLSQFNRLGKHLFDSSGEVGQEVHATVKPASVAQSTATESSVKWNDWNQSPSNSSAFSSSKASSVPFKKFDISLNTNTQDTKQSNETTVTDSKRNRTISIKQTIRTSENATQGQPHAPVNFNVFLGIPTTENPRGKASNTVDVLRLLNALSILRGHLAPPTTILPPVKIVVQVERETKPAKLRCRCFPKSDGCPSELKEEPLEDMCNVKVSIPCCEDG